MSEYQYYEFKAIDKALNNEQITKLHQLSSRAEVSSHRAVFMYNYGDFRGNVTQLMQSSFDVMIYLTNWGDRRLMFRLPSHLVNTSDWRNFFISEAIKKSPCNDNKNFILDFNFQDENITGWTEGEGWLDDLQSLRNDIINGDFRVLYLAWLSACKQLTEWEDIEDDILEPPVPAGLNELNPALMQFVNYIELNPQLVNAAATNSQKLIIKIQDPESLISQLSSLEQQQFLVKLSKNEANLSAQLNHRLKGLNQTAPTLSAKEVERRTFQQLTETANNLTNIAKIKQQEKIKKDRENELRMLARQQGQIWQAVDDFIEQKNSSAYNHAYKQLATLRDIAEFEKKHDEFNRRFLELKNKYSKRRALMERLNRIHML